MVTCCKCSRQQEAGMSQFFFPKDSILRQKWIDFLHFEESCLKIVILSNGKRKRVLKKSSIPNKPCPKCPNSTIIRRRPKFAAPPAQGFRKILPCSPSQTQSADDGLPEKSDDQSATVQVLRIFHTATEAAIWEKLGLENLTDEERVGKLLRALAVEREAVDKLEKLLNALSSCQEPDQIARIIGECRLLGTS